MGTLSRLVITSAVASIVAMPAYAVPIVYTAALSGASESPPNASPGTGSSTVTVDPLANTLRVEISFSGLLGTTLASHIHCCTAVAGTSNAGVATEVPSFSFVTNGSQSGDFFGVEDLSQAAEYNPAFITSHGGSVASAEAALLAGMMSGKAYLNVHSTAFPGGEIRGFLAVPEPATAAMLALAVGALVWRRRSSSQPARC